MSEFVKINHQMVGDGYCDQAFQGIIQGASYVQLAVFSVLW